MDCYGICLFMGNRTEIGSLGRSYFKILTSCIAYLGMAGEQKMSLLQLVLTGYESYEMRIDVRMMSG